MYALKQRPDAGNWQQLDIPGVTMLVFRTDVRTGAMTVLTRLAPGAVIPAHRHMAADESVYVIEGDFVEDDETYGPGSFFFGPAGTTHGPHGSSTGCTVLTHFSAEFDFVAVE